MGNEEEEDSNVRYWKTKYDHLNEDYERIKIRTESLENRLLDVVEENDRKDNENSERIRQLDEALKESQKRVEQLEAACFRYKNQAKGEFASSIKSEEKLEKSQRKDDEDNEYSNELQSVQELRTISGESPRSSIDGITRSLDFHSGDHLICEYHKLPVLAKGEGFIYGFRWHIFNKIHIV